MSKTVIMYCLFFTETLSTQGMSKGGSWACMGQVDMTTEGDK